MKNALVVLGLLVFASFVSVNMSTVYAQEEEAEEYSWGTVAEISGEQIVIVEYNYETEEEQSETYDAGPGC